MMRMRTCRAELIFLLYIILFSLSCTALNDQGDPALMSMQTKKGVTEQDRDDLSGPGYQEDIKAVSRAVPSGSPLKLTLQEALLMALENNRELSLNRITSSIQETFEDQERAIFDPVIEAGLSLEKEKGMRFSVIGLKDASSDSMVGTVSIDKVLPSGTTIGISLDTGISNSSYYTDALATSRIGITVTQALIQGLGTTVNIAGIQQARIDTEISEYELRGFAEFLLAEVEETYWDHVLAQQKIEIFQDSLKLANQQMQETFERIEIGKLAGIELAAAQAEVALRREGLINARSRTEMIRLKLLRLLNPAADNPWSMEIILQELPVIPDVILDNVEDHVKIAMRMRADLNQARLSVKRGDIELTKTKNGILPKMDLFINMGKTGYAGSFASSVSNLKKDDYDIEAILLFEYALGNRSARARHERAALSRRQAVLAVKNLSDLVQFDVRAAYIEVNRTKEQVTATAATRKLQAEKLRAETEKFGVGKSTTLLVAQAQRDDVQSRISEVEAVVNYLKALIGLYGVEGSLLERWGISAPGRGPADF